ncbi:heterokaryon incompatibility protein-domain-containing protein [Xylaria grammica]|nr:heterokaryon incompatibility protein-domain-containing protein [Xylaria grammica]
MLPIYQPEPLLNPRNIRVLDLHPSSDIAAPVHISLRQLCLNYRKTRDAYEALSYVWGSRAPDVPIICDGKTLLVTQNCHDALVRLRASISSKKPRCLWVDAICIDQRGDEAATLERNSQVKQMGEVYTSAKTVIIWLGAPSTDSASFFKNLRGLMRYSWLQSFFETFASILDVIPPMMFLFLGTPPVRKANVEFEDEVAESTTPSEPVLVQEFLDNQWFTRVWTLQELCLARRATVVWGNSSISFHTLNTYVVLSCGLLARKDLPGAKEAALYAISLRYKLAATNTSIYQSSMIKRLWAQNYFSDKRIALYLFEIFKQAGDLKTTVPQDRIFALHSIFERCGITLPDPDYSKPLEQILEETTRAWIEQRKALSILALAGGGGGGSPSWVPHWIKAQDATKEDAIRDYNLQVQIGLHENDIYRVRKPRASKDAPVLDAFDSRPGTLRLKGQQIGHITSTFHFKQFREDNGKEAFGATLWHLCQKVHQTSSYPSRVQPLQAFARILGPRVQSEKRMWKGRFSFKQVSACFRQAAESASASQLPAEWNEFCIVKRLIDLSPCTVFFLSTGYMGVGSPCCREGDAVFLLAGSSWPMVLRRTEQVEDGKAHRLVAPVRIEGVMGGEAWSNTIAELQTIYVV